MMRALSACMMLVAAPVAADIQAADYVAPTDAYGHNVLSGGEYAGVRFQLSQGQSHDHTGAGYVFEDTAPRLVDLDGDGTAEAITVVAYFDAGAAIRIWDAGTGADSTVTVVAETDPIGTRHRWLAIAGAADLDGDGLIEIAYVDRPHVAKVLRVVEVERRGDRWILREEAVATGHTNHRIGDAQIEGGIRLCDPYEIITASDDWSRVVATRLVDGTLRSRDIGPYDGASSLTDALSC